MFSIEAIPCLTALPLQARLGLLFLFLPISQFFSAASLSGGEISFLSPGGWPLPPDSLTTGSHTSNRAGLQLRWCCFPTPPSNRPRIVAQGRVLFSPQNELTPPPKGGGAGYHLGWVRPARSQPGYAGPTGPVWGFAGVVPLPGLQNCTKGHTGASLVFAHSLALLRENIMLLFRTLM